MNDASLDPTPSSLRPIPPSPLPQFDGDDPTWAIAATRRRRPAVTPTATSSPKLPSASPTFHWPEPPQTLEDSGLRATQVEALILKFLLNLGSASGREIAAQIALPFQLVQRLLFAMKEQQLLGLKSDAPLGDYNYELTEFGADRGRGYAEQCTYFGAAPVPIDQYSRAVRDQSVTHQSITIDTVRQAFCDLVLSDSMLSAIGEALNMGRGMFLHGDPGNGKSSVAERITRVFHRHIWIPRALSVEGEVLRLYDSIHHVPVDEETACKVLERPYDQRWVLIKRPTIVMGGELELDGFDITTNRVTNISEAPLQLKANCGTLVIDDFGRNRFRPTDLLNRLVVPMERGVDCFHLKSGRTFQSPCECMLVFASNEVPADIVDEAFLRRIPFKIAVQDPDEQQFKKLFHTEADRLQLQASDEDAEYLLQRHYRETGRPIRFCHPRDILRMIANTCQFNDRPLVVTHEEIDAAVERYVSLKAGANC